MLTASPALTKTLLAYLFLLPAFSLYLKILFPTLATSGFTEWVQLPLELVFTLLAALFFSQHTLSKKSKILLTLFVLWWLSAFVGATQSNHFHASLMKQIEYSIHILFAYAVWLVLSNTNRHVKMVWILIFTFIWVHYYILAAWHSSSDTYNMDWVTSTPMFNNVRHLGYIQIIMLPLLCYPLLKRTQHGQLISFGLLVLFWTGVVWSGSRGSFFAAVVTCAAIYYFFPKHRSQLAFLLVLSCIIGWLIALQFPSISNSMDPWRLLFISESDASKTNANSISSGRIAIWTTSISIWWQSNPLWGLGANGYQYISPLIHSGSTHPHNNVIQFLIDFGIVGFLLLGVAAITIGMHLYTGLSSKHEPLHAKLAQLSVFAFTLGALVDGHFYFSFSLIFFSIIIAIGYARPPQKTPTKDSRLMAIVLIVTCLIKMPLIAKHWGSYIEQQFPLLSEEQLSKVESFPSYYRPLKWLYSELQNPELITRAIKLGQKIGPRHCNYFLLKYHATETKESNLIRDISKFCSPAEIDKFDDPKLSFHVSNIKVAPPSTRAESLQ